MRRLLSALSAGTILALGVAAPASAVDNIALVVEPQLVKAGGVVKLTANNCKNSTATVSFQPSSLGPVTLDQSIGNNSVWSEVKVPKDLPTGIYTATANCSGNDVKAVQSLYVYHPAPAPHKAPNTGGVALDGVSGMTMTAAGVGLVGLGAFLGILAWRRQRASLVD